MLFGGVSLGEGEQQETVATMTKVKERGLDVDV